MDTPENEPKFITCRCQHCDGGIEFDASGFAEGETCKMECPHCQCETEFLVPPPQRETLSAPIPPTPLDPVSSVDPMPTLEIRLTSGASFSVLAMRLCDAKYIEELKTKSADAMQWLEEAAHAESLEAKQELRKLSSGGRIAQQSIRPWNVAPTGAAAIIGFLEPFTAKKSFTNGMQLLKEIKAAERNLVNRSCFFHISRIENIQQAMPDYWRAVFNSTTFVHDGLDFVTIQNVDRSIFSLRWSAVEYFNYSLKNDAQPSS